MLDPAHHHPKTRRMTSFAKAIESGDLEQVKVLLESGLDVNKCLRGTHNKAPAIVLAAERDNIAIVSVLLNAGANVDVCNSVGRTAAHVAAFFGFVDLLRLLTAHKANLGARDQGRRTPLMLATLGKSVFKDRIVVALLEGGAPLLDDRNAVCRAAATSTAAIQLLIDRGVAVAELCDDDGNTPCHFVDDGVNTDAVLHQLVRVCGIDVNAPSNMAGSCVSTFASWGHSKPLRWCIENTDARIDVAGTGGMTPLSIACAHNHPSCVLLLLAAGANFDARDIHGSTATHWTTSGSFVRLAPRLEILHALFAVGADFDARDAIGETPRSHLANRGVQFAPTASEIDETRRRIAALRLSLVRNRAFQICVGLQPLDLDALQTCEILQQACGRFAIPFHQWWAIATAVKHFR